MVQRGRKSLAAMMVVPIEKETAPVTGSRPPRHLGKEELQLWSEMVAELNVATATGFAMLTTALEAHQTMRECRAAIAKEGMVVSAGAEQQLIKANPLLAVERGARQGMINALRQLGFGKASRKKETFIDRFGNLQEGASPQSWECE